jgi:hypothetical protein
MGVYSKEMMDASTILFVGPSYSKAYNLNYLNKYFNSISSELQNVTNIYYKCNYSRSSWIDYKSALLRSEHSNMSYAEKIMDGLYTDKLSNELTELPETEYIDYLGYKYTIGARDGLDSSASARQLTSVLQSNMTKELLYDEIHQCYSLIVDFRMDVSSSIIILNGLFEPYQMYKNSRSKIIYYEDIEHGFEFPRDEAGNLYVEWFKPIPYKWNNVSIDKDDKIYPIKKDGKWLVFDRDIDYTYLLFYNKVMYTYTVNNINEKYITINSIDTGNAVNFKEDEIYLLKVNDTDGKTIVRQQKLIGFYDDSSDTVYFPTNISNALITYNGTYHQFIIKADKKSIKFKIPSEINVNIDIGRDRASNILAINFYSGVITEDAYVVPQAEICNVANTVLVNYRNRLDNALDTINEMGKNQDVIFNDYNDPLTISSRTPNVFKLKYIPEPSSVQLYINNVSYDRNIYFFYNEEDNTIEWTYTSYEGGFDLDNSMEINATYDLYYAKNGIEGADNIKKFKLNNR